MSYSFILRKTSRYQKCQKLTCMKGIIQYLCVDIHTLTPVKQDMYRRILKVYLFIIWDLTIALTLQLFSHVYILIENLLENPGNLNPYCWYCQKQIWLTIFKSNLNYRLFAVDNWDTTIKLELRFSISQVVKC